MVIVHGTITVCFKNSFTNKKEDIILELTVGQNVVHPTHGIGKIIDVTKLNILEDFNRYYVIDFLAMNLTSHIPIKKIEDIGVRIAMTRDKVDQVFGTLRAAPQGLPDHFKPRKKLIADLIQSGRPAKIAQAVRELSWRKANTRLSVSDNRMLTLGRDMLSAEIALVTDCEAVEAKKKIELALNESIEAGWIANG